MRRYLLVLLFAISLAPSAQCEPLPIEKTYAVPGPFLVTRSTVNNAFGLPQYELFYPATVGLPGLRYPLLVWGNGTSATVGQYSRLLTQMASWGFVVIATTSVTTGTGEEMLASLDWLTAANDDPSSLFHHALDPTKIGVFGHSQGAGGSIRTLAAANAPGSTHRFVTTVVPIELPAQKWICFGSLDLGCKEPRWFSGGDIRSGSVFFVNGSRDVIASPSFQSPDEKGEQSIAAFYDTVPDGVAKAKATLLGADHNDIQDACSTACSVGPIPYFGYLVAWMRYRLYGDPIARAAFTHEGTVPEVFQSLHWRNQDSRYLD
ncbi:hypothetical protein LVJ94_29940 [Pendulispora rubella]|uniref:PET hydrolase/cutinase-like domain-containing protein n=1 Tax=Pendulispora rubella TaxID=2741070 RepID=A0ABZ2KRG5_9BACT